MLADAAGQRFGLAIPGREFAADHGPAHRAACLEALAIFAMPRPPAAAGTAAPGGEAGP
jgi:uncharacterized protein (DUF58 family)